METILVEIFSKTLKPSHVSHGLDIPASKLHEFPTIPQGQNHFFVQVTDEAGLGWGFRLATRTVGAYLKPVIASTAWFDFVNQNRINEGDTITFYKEINQDDGQVVGYKVKLQAPGAVRIFGAVIGR